MYKNKSQHKNSEHHNFTKINGLFKHDSKKKQATVIIFIIFLC